MRIIVVGQSLENYLFEIIKLNKGIGITTLFFKKNIMVDLNANDVIVIDSAYISTLPNGTTNTVITFVTEPNYVKCFENEYILTLTEIKKIKEIISKASINNTKYIAVDQSTIDVFSVAKKAAKSTASVFIHGESGVGKEVLSRFIHENSNRANKIFLPINCAAIPDTLLEAELFGHEKGAFTNAINKRIGKFEQANGGTILLDEVSETSLQMQAKLLRVIQEKEITPIGSNSVIKADVRIIATTNRNIYEAIQKGTFREDLFYRLNVIAIEIPKLSKRILDIEALSIFFCSKYSDNKKSLSADALKKLKSYEWPGNVRELENTINRAVVLSDNNEISEKDIITYHPPFSRNKTLQESEQELILNTINQCDGNKTMASKVLGISARTLRNKMVQGL